MPTYNPIITCIDIEETRRYSGLATTRDFNEQLLLDACNEALILVRPRATWAVYKYDAANGIILAPTPIHLTGKNIKKHLSASLHVAVMAVTIGEVLETTISKYFSSGIYTAALLLDAAGTAAVETAADQASNIIQQQAEKQGFSSLWRFSPGYGDWNITVQPEILMLAQGSDIGIEVTDSCMLMPRKSITAIIGLEADLEARGLPPCKTKTCENCNQLNCLARKELK